MNSVAYVIKKWKNPKIEFTNERLTYFLKFTIQHVIYVIKQSPKMFTNESQLFSGYYIKIPLYLLHLGQFWSDLV